MSKLWDYIRGIFGKKECKGFDKMTHEEKKEFLSNDLIERMIRVEQRVSASFGEPVEFEKTKYFKSLSKKEKENFKKYVESKKRRKYIMPFLLVIPASMVFFLRTGITGNVVSEESLEAVPPYLEIILMLFLLAVVVFLFARFAGMHSKEKKFKQHASVIYEVIGGRSIKRKDRYR